MARTRSAEADFADRHRRTVFDSAGVSFPWEMARLRDRAYGPPMIPARDYRQASAPRREATAIGGLPEILQQAERALALRRVYLFGSRARSDARANSDLDLAFEHDSTPAQWAKFVNAVQDEAPVLLDLDLVDLSTATPELRESILREGKLLRG